MLGVLAAALFFQNFVVVQCTEAKILKVNCTSSHQNLYEFDKCSHNETHVNISAILKQPLSKIFVGFWHKKIFDFDNYFLQVSSDTFIKQGKDFKQTFKSSPIDWCAVTSANKQQNRFLRYFIRIIKEMAPRLIQKCPYKTGCYEFLNIRLAKSATNFLPIGMHRIEFKVVDGNSKQFCFVEFDYEVTFWNYWYSKRFFLTHKIKIKK